MKKPSRILMITLVLLAGIGLTSCELFGGSDNPTPTPTPKPTPTPVPTYKSDAERPLTFEATKDGVTVMLKFSDNAKPDYKKVEYSLDEGATWTALSSKEQAITLAKKGDKVMFRGDNPTYNGDAQFVIEQAKSNARAMTRSGIHDIHASAIGNLMSMIQKSQWYDVQMLSSDNTFKALLKGAPIDAKSLDGLNKLVMTANKLTAGSMESLLEGTPITVAPVLSITQLVTDCLKNMCKGCSYLEEVNLSFESLAPGSTLVDCMDGMLKDAGTSSDKPLTLTVDLPTGATLDYVDLAIAAGADGVIIISSTDKIAHVIVTDADGVVHDTYTDEAGNDHDSYKDADGVKHDIITSEGGATNHIIYVKSCAFEQDELTLEVGQEVTLTAVITPNEATDKTVTWKSEDENIATVDKNGKVTAKAVGKIKIRASANGSKDGIDDAVCTVTVVEPTAPSVNDPDDYSDGGDPTAASN
jgi:uncharacterized protein YjdB